VASDWVSTVTVGAVGVLGAFFTWLTGKQGRDHTEKLASDRFDYERQVAADTRRQARIENAYLRLLGLVDQGSAWAQSVKPVLGTIPPRPVPDLPSVEQQVEVGTIVGAFGSAPVQQLYEEWRRVLREVVGAVEEIDRENLYRRAGVSEGTDAGQPWKQLSELRPKERAARDALARQVNTELNGEA